MEEKKIEDNVAVRRLLKYGSATVAYLVAGACLFLYLETCTRESKYIYHNYLRQKMSEHKKLCLLTAKLFNISRNLTKRELANCATEIDARRRNIESGAMKANCQFTWNILSEWIQFCGVTITTIGKSNLIFNIDFPL